MLVCYQLDLIQLQNDSNKNKSSMLLLIHQGRFKDGISLQVAVDLVAHSHNNFCHVISNHCVAAALAN